MIKSFMSNFIIFVCGVITAEILMSLWQNEKMDGEAVLRFSVYGFIGVLIGTWLRATVQQAKQDD